MPTSKKHRWICKELEKFLFSLHPAYDIRVEKCRYEDTLYFPIRDEEGNSWLDPYDPEVTGIKIDYMKKGQPLHIDVVNGRISSCQVADIKARVEWYMTFFPRETWTDHLKELRNMQEDLRKAICKCADIDDCQELLREFPSFSVRLNNLLPYQNWRLCNFVTNLHEMGITVTMNFYLDEADEDLIYATQECLALTEAAIAEDEQSEGDLEDQCDL